MTIGPHDAETTSKRLPAVIDESHLSFSVLRLAWPVVAEQLLTTLVGLVNTVLVGYLGAAALAAIGLAEQAIHFPIALFMAVSIGGTIIVARYIGAGERERANNTAQQSMLLAMVLGVFFTFVAVYYDEEILILLRARPEVVSLGAIYIRLAGFSMPLATLMYVGTGLLRGAGDTRTPLIVMVVVNIVNAILSLLLIRGLFGLPELGIMGAGIAAAVARGAGGLIVLGVLLSGRWAIRWQLRRFFAFDWAEINRILRFGLPVGIEQLQMRVASTTYVAIVASLGTSAYAAHVIAIRIEEAAFMPGFGLGVAATTLVAQSLGAERIDLAERTARLACRYAMIIMGIVGLTFFFFGPQVIGLFIQDADVIAQGAMALKIMAFALPFLGISNTLAGGLRGAGDTRWMMWASTASMWSIRIPGSYLLSTVLGFGLAGAWVGACTDLGVRGILAWWRFAQGAWKLIKI